MRDPGGLLVLKGAGKVDVVSAKLGFALVDGEIGIGHTRWATHGPPTDENAHPHVDCTGKIAVVHNGIIRNFVELRDELKGRHAFKSETDTEVVAHLVEEFYRELGDIYSAFKRAISLLKGSYAIALVTTHEPDRIFFAKSESPLVIGVSERGSFLASDIPALLEHTNKIIVLNDGEVGWIKPGSIIVEDLRTGRAIDIERRVVTVTWKPETVKKGGYPHFMIKEIYEQPAAIRDTLDGLYSDKVEVRRAVDLIYSANRIFVTAAGTSFHAGLILKYFIEMLAHRPVYAFVSSEYKQAARIVGSGDVLVAISQSGETVDTLKAIREFKRRGASIVTLTNVLGSAIYREGEIRLLTRAGPEIGVAATKTFTAQVLVGEYLAIHLARDVGTIDSGEYSSLLRELEKAAGLVGDAIVSCEEEVKRHSEILMSWRSAYYLGRGLGLPLAMEAALKMKEIAYVHAEAYPAGESKHGPIALVEPGFPTIFVGTSESMEELEGNLAEMRARGALVLLYRSRSTPPSRTASIELELPDASPLLEPFVLIPPLQLLSYHVAVRLGRDPDKPRNLAKTVTVE